MMWCQHLLIACLLFRIIFLGDFASLRVRTLPHTQEPEHCVPHTQEPEHCMPHTQEPEDCMSHTQETEDCVPHTQEPEDHGQE